MSSKNPTSSYPGNASHPYNMGLVWTQRPNLGRENVRQETERVDEYKWRKRRREREGSARTRENINGGREG
jgi:hypothetical protein